MLNLLHHELHTKIRKETQLRTETRTAVVRLRPHPLPSIFFFLSPPILLHTSPSPLARSPPLPLSLPTLLRSLSTLPSFSSSISLRCLTASLSSIFTEPKFDHTRARLHSRSTLEAAKVADMLNRLYAKCVAPRCVHCNAQRRREPLL